MKVTNKDLATIKQELIDDNHNSDLWDYGIDTEKLLGDSCDEKMEIEQLLALAEFPLSEETPELDSEEVESIQDDLERICNDTYSMPSDFAAFLESHYDWNILAQGNTYNDENDLANDFCYAIVSPNSENDWCWNRERIYVIVAVLTGGDPRGCSNYATCEVFAYDDCIADSGVLDWSIGWNMESVESDDDIDCEKFSPGYHSSPTSALDDVLDGVYYDDDTDTLYGLFEGNIVELQPYSYYSEVNRIR